MCGSAAWARATTDEPRPPYKNQPPPPPAAPAPRPAARARPGSSLRPVISSWPVDGDIVAATTRSSSSTASATTASAGNCGPDSVHHAPADSCSVGYAAKATRPLAERWASNVQSWPSSSQRIAETGPGPAEASRVTGLVPGRQARRSPESSAKKRVVCSAEVARACRVPGRTGVSIASSRTGTAPGFSCCQCNRAPGTEAYSSTSPDSPVTAAKSSCTSRPLRSRQGPQPPVSFWPRMLTPPPLFRTKTWARPCASTVTAGVPVRSPVWSGWPMGIQSRAARRGRKCVEWTRPASPALVGRQAARWA